MKKNRLTIMIKAFIIGASLLLPGVSGGTTSIVLGVYDDLIQSVSEFFSQFRKSVDYLVTFCIGGGLGILLFARPILYLKQAFEFPIMYFFIGAVIGSIPTILKKTRTSSVSVSSFLYVAAGIAVVMLFELLPAGLFQIGLPSSMLDYLLLAIAGLVAAFAIVLPGISVSYMFLVMGMYDETMAAVGSLNLPYLSPLGIGAVIGTFGLAKILRYAMEEHARPTYLVILGFILGSVVQIFPGIPSGIELLLCPLLFAAGFFLILKFTRTEHTA